jgi:DNA-binding response OmpR family regulator
MQAHNGWIDVESEPGRGTTISLYFPIPKPIEGHSHAAHFSGTDTTLIGTETILLVEDEDDISFFLETILQSHGYRTLVAVDYDRALELFKGHESEIDLVLSDIGLPKVDGIELCAKLKELKPGLKVILSSGYSSKDFQDRISGLESEYFLSKPYTTENILQSVRRVLDGKVSGKA